MKIFFEPTYTLNPNSNPVPKTLNPLALKETYKDNPKGGVGGNAATLPERQEPTGFSKFSFQGSQVKGAVATQAELTGDGVTHKQVYEAFLPFLSFHSVLALEAFYDCVKHCKATPAQWMMLFLDKINEIYRDRGGGATLIDDEDADPAAIRRRPCPEDRRTPAPAHRGGAAAVHRNHDGSHEAQGCGGKAEVGGKDQRPGNSP